MENSNKMKEMIFQVDHKQDVKLGSNGMNIDVSLIHLHKNDVKQILNIEAAHSAMHTSR